MDRSDYPFFEGFENEPGFDVFGPASLDAFASIDCSPLSILPCGRILAGLCPTVTIWYHSREDIKLASSSSVREFD